MQQKLTDSQLVIMSAASAREAHNVLPLPASLTLNKGSAALVLKSLIARALITEVRASPRDELWRDGEDGRWTLRLTHGGLKLLGLDADEEDPAKGGNDAPDARVEPAAGGRALRAPPAPGTKLAILLQLLRQSQGATLAELMSACGWQAHSVRGAISGAIRKELGLPIDVEMVEGRGKVYRIQTAVAGGQPDEAA